MTKKRITQRVLYQEKLFWLEVKVKGDDNLVFS